MQRAHSSPPLRTDLNVALEAIRSHPDSLKSLESSEQAFLLEQAEASLLAKAKTSFRSFVQSIDLPGVPVRPTEDDRGECEEFYPIKVDLAAHHRLICSLLQKVYDGRIQRLMLFLPPGSAKSVYATVSFPAFFMGNRPKEPVIALSYASDLARKFGRRTRSIVKQKKFEQIFGCTLSAESSAADEWTLTNGAEYLANGILGGVTGNRASGLIIDDPVRGRRDADSETFQKATYEAYINDARTRLKPGAWQIIIQTRWSENDLSGQILPENYDGRSGWVKGRDGFDWFVVSIPMEAERDDDPLGRRPGEFLWSGYFRPEEYLPLKYSKRPDDQRTWSALYQQRPAADDGIYYKREWFKWYEWKKQPKWLTVYGTSDFAVTSNGGDYTVHGVWGVDPNDDVYLLDLWRGQETTLEWAQAMGDLIKQWKPLMWVSDADQITKSVGPFLNVHLAERELYIDIRTLPMGRQDKAMRARSFQGRAANGKVYLPQGAPWIDAWLREHLTFGSGGKFDDQVDCSGLLGRTLDELVGGEKPEDVVKTNPDDYLPDMSSGRHVDGNWSEDEDAMLA
jgi:predicted phage terminase large subunit-like protein